MPRVYLDHNATTPLRDEVREHYFEALARCRANPSSVHASGREARMMIDLARERCASALRVHEDELIFTSGGTEAANLAVLGVLRTQPKTHALAVSAIEHPAVSAAALQVEQEGWPVHRLAVDQQGRLALEPALERLAKGAPCLLAMMRANNEVGSLLDHRPLLAQLRGRRPWVFVDAVQALGRLPLDWHAEGVDLAAVSAHKVGGPLGVGLLFRRKGLSIKPLHHGGSQEAGLRPGTENAPAISAAALAIELAVAEQVQLAQRQRALLLDLWRGIQSAVPGARVFGPEPQAEDRLPNTLNVELPGWDGRLLVARLDLEGLETSSGSACASGSLEASPVLLAMGFAPERARAGLRLSLGRATNSQDIHSAVDILRRVAHSRT